MTFFQGQKVTLRKEFEGLKWYMSGSRQACDNPPVFGEVYVIRGIDSRHVDGVGLYFANHPDCSIMYRGIPYGWESSVFEPIVDKTTETGMAILREILNTVKEDA